jgi:glyoxylase I family protein
MNARQSPAGSHRPSSTQARSFVLGFHGVRYQVKDVSRSVAFYAEQLGFSLEHQKLPEFATVAFEDLKIHLSGPGASGSRTMPDGHHQEPGGWNRVVLRVADLPALIDVLKKAGLHFRNEMEVGPAGKQIQLQDPDGNPIELFEPAQSSKRPASS